jgi:hypothetical protein
MKRFRGKTFLRGGAFGEVSIVDSGLIETGLSHEVAKGKIKSSHYSLVNRK